MFQIDFQNDVLKRRFTHYEKAVFPAALQAALNETGFYVRDGFKVEFQKVFDRPTAYTMNSALFTKATKDNLVAEVFIKDESNGGTPPAKYLLPEAAGGGRGQKSFEKRLQNAVGTPAGRFYAFGRDYPRDPFGNLSRGVYSKILSQLHAQSDRYNNETEKKRHARLRRQARKGGGGSFFVLGASRGKLKAGTIYERIVTGHGTTVRTVLAPIKQARYPVRFNVEKTATRLFQEYFPASFKRWFDTFSERV